jgi:hypothetical protein
MHGSFPRMFNFRLRPSTTQIRDTAIQIRNTAIQIRDTAIQIRDTAIQIRDTAIQIRDTAIPKISKNPTCIFHKDTVGSRFAALLPQGRWKPFYDFELFGYWSLKNALDTKARYCTPPVCVAHVPSVALHTPSRIKEHILSYCAFRDAAE